jgi:hypothetical protein
MHDRHGDYPSQERHTRGVPATTRYALTWIVATAATVIGIAAVLRAGAHDPLPLSRAIERAACRLEPAPRGTTELWGAVDAGKVVIRYRVTLSVAQAAQLRSLVRRLPGGVVTEPGPPRFAPVVEATAAQRRLGCDRLDERTQDALILFARSVRDRR